MIDVTSVTNVISVATSPLKRKRLGPIIPGVSRHDSVTLGPATTSARRRGEGMPLGGGSP